MKLGAKISGVCQGRPLAAGWEGLPKGGEGAGRGPGWSGAGSSGGARISLMQAEIFCHKRTQKNAKNAKTRAETGRIHHEIHGIHGIFSEAEGEIFVCLCPDGVYA